MSHTWYWEASSYRDVDIFCKRELKLSSKELLPCSHRFSEHNSIGISFQVENTLATKMGPLHEESPKVKYTTSDILTLSSYLYYNKTIILHNQPLMTVKWYYLIAIRVIKNPNSLSLTFARFSECAIERGCVLETFWKESIQYPFVKIHIWYIINV